MLLLLLRQVCIDLYHVVHEHALPKLADTAVTLQKKLTLPAGSTVPHRSSNWRRRQALLRKQLEQLRALPGKSAQGLTWRFWNQLASDSQGLFAARKQTEMMEGVKVVTGRVTGTKAELVVRLFGVLGLKAPAAAPAKLLAALQEQRLRTRL
jgi:hypothetical protein